MLTLVHQSVQIGRFEQVLLPEHRPLMQGIRRCSGPICRLHPVKLRLNNHLMLLLLGEFLIVEQLLSETLGRVCRGCPLRGVVVIR